ncbi:MAG: 5'-nucleotidase C-terminal domain-containing protein, partial [Abditibacteriota bacterium]|nr:5'-nucleotidase C-terminal domain-containing protein [Abditibacteriota bacterium]
MTRYIIVLLLTAAALGCAAFEEPVSAVGAQKQTTSGGNLLADALRYAARTDAALVISSDLREITCPGDAPAEELVSLAAVKSDRVYSMNLTGSVLKQALSKSLFLYPRANPAFMHMSGIRVTM